MHINIYMQESSFVKAKSLMGKLVICCLQFCAKDLTILSKQILEGLLEYFFPANSTVQYNSDDIHWFFEQISLKPCSFARVFSSKNAEINFLSFFLIRILSSGGSSQSTIANPLFIFNDKVIILDEKN